MTKSQALTLQKGDSVRVKNLPKLGKALAQWSIPSSDLMPASVHKLDRALGEYSVSLHISSGYFVPFAILEKV